MSVVSVVDVSWQGTTIEVLLKSIVYEILCVSRGTVITINIHPILALLFPAVFFKHASHT